MGLFNKLLVGGGVVLAGAAARSWHKEAQETKLRRSSPLRFGEPVTQYEFTELAHEVARRTARVQEVAVDGMDVTIKVASNSGLTTWTADIDFNDYGHLTGTYWLSSENSDSLIPEHFASAMKARLETRVAEFRAGQLF
jgi:hypothetical protein